MFSMNNIVYEITQTTSEEERGASHLMPPKGNKEKLMPFLNFWEHD